MAMAYNAPAALVPPGASAPSGMQPPNNQAYDYTFFQNYGVNPRIDTEDDALSTFGLDVDTGSYTIMRSYVDQGSLPPTDSVRVEEYVNYFNQGYPFPPEGQAFGINIDGGPSPFAESERYQMLRIGIQGYAVPAEFRKDVSLTFVIDVSGSMDMDNRLGLVKRTLGILVEQLRPTDQVSIVLYGTDARVVLGPTSGNRKQVITRAINSLQAEGVTNAEAGLRLGYQMADKAFNPDGINRVILCSDGVANMGETGAGSIWDEIKEYAGNQITLTTVGFGMDNFNDVLLEQLADKGNGFYAYVDTIEEARRIFVDNLTSTLQVIARDARVQVEFNPEVVSRYRLVGYENRAIADADFRNDNVDAGEVGAGHSVTALYEVKLNEGAEGKIATVYLRWQNPNSEDTIETSQDFYTSQMSPEFNETDAHFQWSVIVAEYAEILRDSYWAKGRTLSDVLDQAKRVSRTLENPDMEEFVNLVHQAVDLSGE
jgi:Ca-activated chloride channel family protein